ncbi:glucosidase II beta subunit-like protein [Pseudomassariella vexata]|uniref:Glucosidase 2 subunit beta n=1 Tax=Pseudomassariella vexata TaxID=1141098 RepID=A0A1Y2DQC7_9PEZI|nr:glucosidase II beta subunit-like protein [Pseudomassariella vexata]ORY61501.1 glucosidase II beta subunit-like protein [Pseudomassariella vexata]
MRQLHILVLISTAAYGGIVAAGTVPRGVGPEFAKFYDITDTFACIGHPSISIAVSKVNDNSCDCPDGSDEPGTAACANIDPLSPPQPLPNSLSGTTNTSNALPGFWCANEGHIGTYVPFMYVNDGVCDYDLCCDGTEEYGGVGGVKCPNKCKEIGKEWRRIDNERKENLERANKRRRIMVKEAKELRRRVEAKITSLTEEIKSLETKRDELKKKHDEIEHSERGKVVKGEGTGKLGVLVGLAKGRVNELRDTLNIVLGQRDELRGKVAELEGILATFKEEYNPNFNDEGVKKAVRAWEDYAAKMGESKDDNESDIQEVLKEDNTEGGINWDEYVDGEEATDTDILYSLEAYLPGQFRDFIHDKVNLLRIWLIENGIMADNPSSKGESRLVVAAREAYEAVDKDITNKQRDLDGQQADLAKDYGADDIFRYLKDKCVSIDSGEYEYELCWLSKTAQKSKKGGGSTNMGHFDHIDIEESDEEERHDGKGLGRGKRMVMRYDNGQHCWNGPNRRTDVWLACAEQEELWRVSELEKCVYKMEVGTPAACEEAVEPGQAKQGKDEL